MKADRSPLPATSSDFVELNRWFVPIGRDEEPNIDIGLTWGRKIGGWLNWQELRERRRVVLLAEALSGKSEEFRNQAEILAVAGEAAFYLRIEELADQGFDAALEPSTAGLFEDWRKGSAEGWFFLDSVDEARLNGKSLDTALKRFVRELDQSLPRARVFVSCRVSDWKGREDRALIERRLPVFEVPQQATPDSADSSPLLTPIFGSKEPHQQKNTSDSEPIPKALLVVRLVPLSMEQCRTLAERAGVSDISRFAEEIERNGLDAYTERPGDVLDLAEYWKTYKRFGSLTEMVGHAIDRKLQEQDQFRGDSGVLSLSKARAGAERLATALTLGKSFTLRAPGTDPDPSLAAGALDPAHILDDWSDAERAALLRRGIFAPATYGRIRFHHRSSQEYLAAQWLHHLLQANCPRSEIWALLFGERYGVETVVPSLRPEAVWLSLRHPDFREEILRREPLLLVRHGDPRSLPLETKERLLAAYAAKHAAGEISDDTLDSRSIGMFTDPKLAEAIQEAWKANGRDDFRFDLLRLIRDGAISACNGLARKVALDDTAPDHLRTVALEALRATRDKKALSAVAKQLIGNASKTKSRITANFARTLFPEHLSVDELFALVAKSPPPSKNSTEGGFAHEIVYLYKACPDVASRTRFVDCLARICLRKPFVGRHERISKRYSELAGHAEPIAVAEVAAFKGKPPAYLVKLLMAVERARERTPHAEDDPNLFQMMRDRPHLQRALFWADVGEHRRNKDEVLYYWQMVFLGTPLWRLGENDLGWLFEDLAARPYEADRRIALSAIVSILRDTGRLKRDVAELRKLVRSDPVLLADLKAHLTPPKKTRGSRHLHRHSKKTEKEREAQKERDKRSWVEFEHELRRDPSLIRDPKYLKSWKTGAYRLKHLTHWLQRRANVDESSAPKEWRLLEEGFGNEVAEAYRDGMKALWRLTPTKAPTRSEGGGVSSSWMTILAYGGVHIEALENPDWASGLSQREAKRAAQHGCISEQGYPEWLDDLIVSHPKAVLPVVRQSLTEGWSVSSEVRSDLIYRYANPAFPILPALRPTLFEVLISSEPNTLSMLDRGLRIFRNLNLNEDQRRQLLDVSRQRYADHVKAGRTDFAIRYLALLLMLDLELALDDLEMWINSGPDAPKVKAERAFGLLFNRHDPLVTGVLTQASVPTLGRLLLLAYTYVRPMDDVIHEGTYTPGTRDNAEDARNVILSAVVERPGADTFRVLQRITLHPAVTLRATRFRELARSKAERDSEIPAWSAKEVLGFERQHTAPVKTGADLLKVVMGVLVDIQRGLTAGDVTSRPLLERAASEDEVQNWVVEQINFRSRERFHAHREAQVAGGNMPDIILSSTAAPCQVAIEVKHGGKGWSFADLENALRNQLAGDYLKVAERRHGILLVSHHKNRAWIDPTTSKRLTFERLIEQLGAVAAELVENKSLDPIEVRCVGIDASSPAEAQPARRKPSRVSPP
ncbi:hypothetical protein [Inquilinus sp. CA228]|uniref:hypothetical protein n=1 Tax=Inquilinus sp. CA228 TaxID=3455609 RepID=UPI003F8D7658